MITVKNKTPVYRKDSNGKRAYRFSFFGLASDTLPTGEYEGCKIANGSKFTLIDGDESRLYDETSKVWHTYHDGSGGGGGGDVSDDQIVTPDDASDIFDRAKQGENADTDSDVITPDDASSIFDNARP